MKRLIVYHQLNLVPFLDHYLCSVVRSSALTLVLKQAEEESDDRLMSYTCTSVKRR